MPLLSEKIGPVAARIVAARRVVGTAKPGSGLVSRAEVTKPKAPPRRGVRRRRRGVGVMTGDVVTLRKQAIACAGTGY